MKRKTALIILYVAIGIAVVIIAYSIYTKEYYHVIRGILFLAAATYSIVRINTNLPVRNSEFEKVYAKMLEGSFDDKKLRNELFKGILALNLKNPTKALNVFNTLLVKCSQQNDLAVLHHFIGCTYEDLGDTPSAVENYKQSINYNPMFYKAYTYLAAIYKNEGDFSQAIDLLNKAIEVEPKNYEAYLLIASIKYNMMEYREAIDYANHANGMKARLYQATQILALSYAALGDTKNAENYYKMSITYGCQNPRGLRDTIDAMYSTGKTLTHLNEYYSDIFEKTKRNGIHFEQIKGEINLCSSKFGGNPHLPDGFNWPLNLNFLMQINLSDVKPYDTENLLPKGGMLYFFYDYTNQPWDPEEGTYLVYYSNSIDNIREVTAPTGIQVFDEYLLSFESFIDIPPYEEQLLYNPDINDELYEDYALKNGFSVDEIETNKLLGYAGFIQDELVSSANGILLAQIFSTNDIMFGDTGNLYFYIAKEDLANCDFSNVKVFLQCY